MIGAGASCELDFPSGPKLLQYVASALDIRFQAGIQQSSGDPGIMEEYRRHHRATDPNSDINQYLHAGWRLRDAANVARSIDNAIDQNDDNPLVPLVGKLAIAKTILTAERRSKLKHANGDWNAPPQISAVGGTWLYHLAQIITTDLKKADVERAFENATFVTFNYDRSLEHFLPSILVEAYGLDAESARSIAATAKVIHPYGCVGKLPWLPSGAVPIPYGGDPQGRLFEISQALQTFCETTESTAEMKDLHTRLSLSNRIVFLGFGFHRQNMDLLKPEWPLIANRVLGTVYKEPLPAQDGARGAIMTLCDHLDRGNVRSWADLQNLTCAEFLRQFYSPLTS